MNRNMRKFVLMLILLPITMNACGVRGGIDVPEPSVAAPSPQPTEQPASASKPAGSPTPTLQPSHTPEPTRVETKRDVKVKGLYLTGWTAGSKEKMEGFIKLADETELNAFVIDIKNDDGIVSYASEVAEVQKYGTFEKKFNPQQLIKTLHDKGIYVIGRVVCFRDPAFSKKNPDRAVKHTDGGLWKEEKKNADITWLNPCDKRNWTYVLEIAKEAAALGFDEIQFDYIRFPYGDRSKMDFGTKGFVKHEVINEFLALARKEMPQTTLSADIFGIVCVSPEDTEDIGQYLELIGKDMDYISPMTYPALYARGQIVNGVKFPNPDLEPYNVVYQTLLMADKRLSQVEDYRAEVRPFIQAFTASWLEKGSWQTYGAKQYQQQIKAVEDAGYEQWIFWDANNRYDFSAFRKE